MDIVLGKGGQELTVLGNTQIKGKGYLFLEMKNPHYIDGVLTRYILGEAQNLTGIKVEGEFAEDITDQEIKEPIEEKINNE